MLISGATTSPARTWTRDNSPYALQTLVVLPNQTPGVLAKTLFDTGSDVELVSRGFVENAGLSTLITPLKAKRFIVGLGGGQLTAVEEVVLKWIFCNKSPIVEVKCYVVDLPEDEFDLLLGREFLHRNEIVVLQLPNLPANRPPTVAKARATTVTVDPTTDQIQQLQVLDHHNSISAEKNARKRLDQRRARKKNRRPIVQQTLRFLRTGSWVAEQDALPQQGELLSESFSQHIAPSESEMTYVNDNQPGGSAEVQDVVKAEKHHDPPNADVGRHNILNPVPVAGGVGHPTSNVEQKSESLVPKAAQEYKGLVQEKAETKLPEPSDSRNALRIVKEETTSLITKETELDLPTDDSSRFVPVPETCESEVLTRKELQPPTTNWAEAPLKDQPTTSDSMSSPPISQGTPLTLLNTPMTGRTLAESPLLVTSHDEKGVSPPLAHTITPVTHLKLWKKACYVYLV